MVADNAAAAPAAMAAPSLEYLAMVNERMTALEVGLDSATAALRAVTTSLDAYKKIMPRPEAYYFVLRVADDTALLDVRRAVLTAVASALQRTHWRVRVCCFLSVNGPWLRDGVTTAAVVFVSGVGFGCCVPTHDPGAMYAALASCGASVVQAHAVMSLLEEQYFLHSLLDDEVLVPVRAAEAHTLLHANYVQADHALGWCVARRRGIYESVERVMAWASATGFELFIPRKGHNYNAGRTTTSKLNCPPRACFAADRRRASIVNAANAAVCACS
jgi:predicted phage tail protein